MTQVADWTTTWLEAYEAEDGRQQMYDGTAREVAEAKGWTVLESLTARDMVLAETESGELMAIGPLPRAYGFWSVAIGLRRESIYA